MRPCELPIDPLPLATFFIYRNKLVAEASDFGAAFRLQRLYDDACDVGIAVKSHHTGRVVRFALTNVDERDGEIRAWEFDSVDPNVRMKAVVLND